MAQEEAAGWCLVNRLPAIASASCFSLEAAGV